MKIGYLTSSFAPSGGHDGWSRFATELIEGVRRAGHETAVYTDTVLAQRGLRKAIAPFAHGSRARAALTGCDIIHALDAYPAGAVGALSGLRAPLVVTAQGAYSVAPLYRPASRWAGILAIRKAAAVTAISRYTKQEVANASGRSDIIVIGHGIDTAKFLRPRIDSGERFILSVGGLKDRKGYHVSIPAFAQFKKRFPGYRYKIVYGWGDPSPYRALAHSCGVADSVDFLERISDEELLQLYQRARLFVQLSVNDGHHFEGFGLVFLEAAACGVPVVGTLGNGIEDAVNDGVNGKLVPQNDHVAASLAMESIIADDGRWESMSAAGYMWAKTHELHRAVSQYISLYDNLYTQHRFQ